MSNPKRIQWSKEHVKIAFSLYCKLPFGKLHKSNPDIVCLANLLGRTPSAVAMKLVNIASLDPAITSTGRSGLKNASAMDKEVWKEFSNNWDELALESLKLYKALEKDKGADLPQSELDRELESYVGETKSVVIQQRVRQDFFRKSVLSSYKGTCCMSGLSEARLLIASHIVPWSEDKLNRLNPRNGLCLSAIHDKAFDRGFITLDDDFRVVLSRDFKANNNPFIQQTFSPIEGKPITLPERFKPDISFLAKHRNLVFLDKKVSGTPRG